MSVARTIAALGCVATLSACTSVGGFTGAAAGIASGAATANPAVGVAVGIGVKAATDAGIKYFTRTWQQHEQNEIAALIGAMREDEVRDWRIQHAIPYGNQHGEVRVTRTVQTPLAQCKEALFSVVDDKTAARAWFVGSACRRGGEWKWAVAEPAVERWGALQ